MINAITAVKNQILSPSRQIKGRVAFYAGATTTPSYFSYADALQSIEISKAGEESKFFGFGVCQKATIKLRDNERQININPGDGFQPFFGALVNDSPAYAASTYARMYADEVKRDENSNVLTITASDKLYTDAFKYTYAELGMVVPYSIQDVATACATKLGLALVMDDSTASTAFSKSYEVEANFDGAENLREVLNAVAEATQTIYYIRGTDLHFKCLLQDTVDYTIDKTQYFTLESKTQHTLSAICSATELGDNVIATSDIEGETQYVRNNPFWETQADVNVLVENALALIGGIQSHQFNCSWRGNFLLEIGDKIEFITKDNNSIYGYFLNDTTTYDGGFKQTTDWNYDANSNESVNNPSTLGEKLKQTFAKVDKVNKEIELVVSETEEMSSQVSNMKMTTDSIAMSVEDMTTRMDDTNESIETLTSKVNASISKDELKIEVQNELANGVSKVQTGKGFTFDDNGLTIEDINPNTNNKITTTVSNNGMVVYRDDEAVLTANDRGVKAKDLQAETYLIVGTNSRFEDYGYHRTGCFWVGSYH